MAPLPPPSRNAPSSLPLPLLWIKNLLVERRFFWYFASLVFLGELVLGLLILRFVPYTEIDYAAYMEQVAGFLGGERDYSQLKGGTGPLVYPALHLYLYTLLSYLPTAPPTASSLHLLLPSDNLPTHLLPQLVFLALYLAQFLLTAWVYYQADIPQYALIPLALSKRAHSVWILRLFGDGWAVWAVWMAVGCWIKGWWISGSVLYSLALGVKMNILLYLPGLLLIYWKALGPIRLVLHLLLIVFIQLILPYPFFTTTTTSIPLPTYSYLTSAFDLSRSFLHVWTVNWRFVPEQIFLDQRFHLALLAAQGSVLALFGWRWCWSEDGGEGAWGLVKTGVRSPWTGGVGRRLGKREIPAILFTSNLVGILFARSLHYQFQSWYFHQLPFLLFLTPFPLPVSALLWAFIEFGWSTYPSTNLSSGLLFGANALLLVGVWFGDAEGRERGAAQEKEVEKTKVD
ncbi:glycosyltransferase [Mrakia frigida]|uniref:dolichyl-P-Man:Man(5)GlcNAc(2)-PP-dolichol alpha-1,3-mannosyltransferase n=1 Tax=Mrakia frigida TaxID=29902 RepID=UPI003FCC0595